MREVGLHTLNCAMRFMVGVLFGVPLSRYGVPDDHVIMSIEKVKA